MQKTRLVIIGLAGVFMMVSTVCAQPQGEHQLRGAKQRESISKELNLTPEQQKKLDQNRNAQRQEIEKLVAALKEKQVKLKETLQNPVVTKDTVQPLANEIKNLQSELVDNRIGGIIAVKEILTPEQFVKFQQIMEKQKKDMQERFGKLYEKKKFAGRDGNEQKPVK
jgi:Spy/CpxP family protein refolding chaperone